MTETSKRKTTLRSATEVVGVGNDPAKTFGFVNPPVYRGSTVLFSSVDTLKSRKQPYTYGRRCTPTTAALEKALCHLEAGAVTILTSSGLQACTCAILSLVESGDHILVTDSVYSPTRAFCNTTLRRLGVETTYFDPMLDSEISTLFKRNTKLVFCESPGSQTFEVQDIPGISAAARENGIWLILDNTWATPLYFQPLKNGVDLSIQAVTKYISGHSDVVLGAITGNKKAAHFLTSMKEAIGTCPGSEEVYLALRGLRSLHVRMERHHQSGIRLARWLKEHRCVKRVMHPGLPGDPGHRLWKRDFQGASGLFGITLKPVSDRALAKMLDGMRLFSMGYSWGGYESLILPFDVNQSRTATRWEDPGPCLRIHVGLEDVEDLRHDLEEGFLRLEQASSKG